MNGRYLCGIQADQMVYNSSSADAICREIQDRQAAMRVAVDRMMAEAQRAADAMPDVMQYLSYRGWHFTYRFCRHWFTHLERWIQADSHDQVDEFMCEFARKGLISLESGLIQRFPHRALIVADAFKAHRDGKYTLSVPVLLAQADGIGCEILDIPRTFYKAKNRSDALQAKLDAFTLCGRPYPLRGVQGIMLSPLRNESSLATATEKRALRRQSEPWFCPLNRHGVLHGLDSDYASEANSLRCVTLLEYLHDVDRILGEHVPKLLAELNEAFEQAYSQAQSRCSHG